MSFSRQGFMQIHSKEGGKLFGFRFPTEEDIKADSEVWVAEVPIFGGGDFEVPRPVRLAYHPRIEAEGGEAQVVLKNGRLVPLADFLGEFRPGSDAKPTVSLYLIRL